MLLGLVGCGASGDDDDSAQSGSGDDDHAAADDDSATGDDDNDAADDDATDDDTGLTIELVEGGAPGADGVAIVRTADGVIHIAEAKAGYLSLHHWQPGNASASQVERLGRGGQPRLAADGQGRLHLLYFDPDSAALMYATQAGGGWVSQPVAEHASDARLAVSAEGVAHLAVIHESSRVLDYLHNASGAFAKQEIARAADPETVFRAAIALDPTGGVQLAYIIGEIEWLPHWLESWSGVLTHASNKTGDWVKTTVFSGGICTTLSLAVDADGFAHLGYERFLGYYSYMLYFLGDLSYSTNRSGTWERRRVATLGYGDADIHILVGEDGAPRLLYRSDQWMYAVAAGIAWSKRALPNAYGAAMDAVLDQADALHAANGAANGMTLVYITDAGGLFEHHLVDRGLYVEGGLSAAVDPTGGFAVAYPWRVSSSSGVLGWRLADRGDDGWTITSPLGERQVDTDSVALAYDDQGFAHVTYYDANASKLVHATNAPSGEWTTQNLMMGEVYCAAIAWRGGPSGEGHIAYVAYNGASDNAALYYASYENGAWQSERLDRRAACPAIAVGPDGPHLAYSADATREVTHLAKVDGQWVFEVVEEYPFDALPQAAVALSDDGRVHIAYDFAWFDEDLWQDREEIHYAVSDGAGWLVEVVDPYAGSRASLATDEDRRPHLAYYSSAEHSVRYAFRAGAADWRRAVLDDAHDGASLALDQSGRAHVAYVREATLFHAQFPAGYEAP